MKQLKKKTPTNGLALLLKIQKNERAQGAFLSLVRTLKKKAAPQQKHDDSES